MPALKPFSLFQRSQRVLMALLVGVLFLTNSAFLSAQGQTTDPYEKKMPANGVRPKLPQALAPAPAQGATAANSIQDPSFEASYNTTAYWDQFSTNFGTPLCIVAVCGDSVGTAGPRTGSVWSWFGGTNAPVEESGVAQFVILPSCGATLRFYLWIGRAASGSDSNDYLRVTLNGTTQLFRTSAAQRSSYTSYRLVTINIAPGTFTSGGNWLVFDSRTTNQVVNFNLDDVTLTPNCLIIAGNAGVAGATINYTGGSTTANSAGDYAFNRPAGWSGTVTPSKNGYRFSPVNRTYSNVLTHRFNQDFTAIPVFSISGTTGVGGVTLSYTDGTPRTVTSQPNGNYSLFVPEFWNGTVTPTHPCFTFSPTDLSYGSVTGNQTAQDYTPTLIPGCADIDISVGGALQGQFGLSAGASTRASFTGLNNGPVKMESTNAIQLIGAERLIYKAGGVTTSFSEMMGLPAAQLDTTYYLPWYNNVDLDTQLRIANATNNPATVTVTIGGVAQTPINLAAGESTRVSYAGVNNGPVKIVSDQDIVATERVIYKVAGKQTSFSEMMALPESQLDTTYWLPWYNNVDLDTQLRIGNVSGATATVHVFIGGNEVTPVEGITLLDGESTRLSYAGVNNGPVQIVSDQNIVAAERVIYKVNNLQTSFTEMMALPNSQLNTTYWLPWYNNVDLDTQLRIGNVSNATATVHVFIGGTEVTPVSGISLLPGESTRVSFVGVNNGPVQIVSDQDIVAAERVIYKVNGVNTSFAEMMALPESQLDTTYWFPWYNNVDMDTQMRFGVP